MVSPIDNLKSKPPTAGVTPTVTRQSTPMPPAVAPSNQFTEPPPPKDPDEDGIPTGPLELPEPPPAPPQIPLPTAVQPLGSTPSVGGGGVSQQQVLDAYVKPGVKQRQAADDEFNALGQAGVAAATQQSIHPYLYEPPDLNQLTDDFASSASYMRNRLGSQIRDDNASNAAAQYAAEALKTVQQPNQGTASSTGGAFDWVNDWLGKTFNTDGNRQYITPTYFDKTTGQYQGNFPAGLLYGLGLAQNSVVGGALDLRNAASNAYNMVPQWMKPNLERALGIGNTIMGAPGLYAKAAGDWIRQPNRLNDGKSNFVEALRGAQYSFTDPVGTGVGIKQDSGFRVGAAAGKGIGFDVNPTALLGFGLDVVVGSKADDLVKFVTGGSRGFVGALRGAPKVAVAKAAARAVSTVSNVGEAITPVQLELPFLPPMPTPRSAPRPKLSAPQMAERARAAKATRAAEVQFNKANRLEINRQARNAKAPAQSAQLTLPKVSPLIEAVSPLRPNGKLYNGTTAKLKPGVNAQQLTMELGVPRSKPAKTALLAPTEIKAPAAIDAVQQRLQLEGQPLGDLEQKLQPLPDLSSPMGELQTPLPPLVSSTVGELTPIAAKNVGELPELTSNIVGELPTLPTYGTPMADLKRPLPPELSEVPLPTLVNRNVGELQLGTDVKEYGVRLRANQTAQQLTLPLDVAANAKPQALKTPKVPSVPNAGRQLHINFKSSAVERVRNAATKGDLATAANQLVQDSPHIELKAPTGEVSRATLATNVEANAFVDNVAPGATPNDIAAVKVTMEAADVSDSEVGDVIDAMATRPMDDIPSVAEEKSRVLLSRRKPSEVRADIERTEVAIREAKKRRLDPKSDSGSDVYDLEDKLYALREDLAGGGRLRDFMAKGDKFLSGAKTSSPEVSELPSSFIKHHIRYEGFYKENRALRLLKDDERFPSLLKANVNEGTNEVSKVAGKSFNASKATDAQLSNLGEAIATMHNKGVKHNDLHYANALVDGDTVRVIDFAESSVATNSTTLSEDLTSFSFKDAQVSKIQAGYDRIRVATDVANADASVAGVSLDTIKPAYLKEPGVDVAAVPARKLRTKQRKAAGEPVTPAVEQNLDPLTGNQRLTRQEQKQQYLEAVTHIEDAKVAKTAKVPREKIAKVERRAMDTDEALRYAESISDTPEAFKRALDLLPAVVTDTPQAQAIANVVNARLKSQVIQRATAVAEEAAANARAALADTPDIGRRFSMDAVERPEALLNPKQKLAWDYANVETSVYHGTRVDNLSLENADPLLGASRSELGVGHYFTTNKNEASRYAIADSAANLPSIEGRNIGQPRVIEAYIDDAKLISATVPNALPAALAEQVAQSFPELKGAFGKFESVVSVYDKASAILDEPTAREFQRHMAKAYVEKGVDGVRTVNTVAIYNPAMIAQGTTELLDDSGSIIRAKSARTRMETSAVRETDSQFSKAAAADARVSETAQNVEELQTIVDDHAQHVSEVIDRSGLWDDPSLEQRVEKLTQDADKFDYVKEQIASLRELATNPDITVDELRSIVASLDELQDALPAIKPQTVDPEDFLELYEKQRAVLASMQEGPEFDRLRSALESQKAAVKVASDIVTLSEAAMDLPPEKLAKAIATVDAKRQKLVDLLGRSPCEF